MVFTKVVECNMPSVMKEQTNKENPFGSVMKYLTFQEMDGVTKLHHVVSMESGFCIKTLITMQWLPRQEFIW